MKKLCVGCEECNEVFYKSVESHADKILRSPLKKRTRNLCVKCSEIFKNIADETGNTYGCLKVIKFDGSRKGKAYWLCECDCSDVRLYKGNELRKLGDTRVCTHGENKWNTIRSYFNKVTV